MKPKPESDPRHRRILGELAILTIAETHPNGVAAGWFVQWFNLPENGEINDMTTYIRLQRLAKAGYLDTKGRKMARTYTLSQKGFDLLTWARRLIR